MAAELTLVVIDRAGELPSAIAGAKVITARCYLADETAHMRGTRVINLCRYDQYQSSGYYVSLLAEARGHVALPEMRLLGDFRGELPAALTDAPLVAMAQAELAELQGHSFTLDAIFGIDPVHAHDSLAAQVFERVPAPAMRVSFARRGDCWHVSRVRAMAIGDLPQSDRALLMSELEAYLARLRPKTLRPSATPALGILYSEDAPNPPSNRDALENFRRVGASLGMHVEFLRKDQSYRLPQFDGLFIRDTTNVEHYTYDVARCAADLGLIVIDDPESILKCTNKVFLHEILGRHQVPIPRTLLVHRENADAVLPTLGLPCVLKQPDSAFSLGVFKVESREALAHALTTLLAKSDLVVAQEWVPTPFDWRVGVLDRRAIYVCKYFMAPGHWQVVKHEAKRKVEGSTAAMTVGEAPRAVIEAAVAAANLIGDGLYGVDIKEANGKCYVMEVNDNPNIDAGNEDGVSKDALYREILGVFLRRIRERTLSNAA